MKRPLDIIQTFSEETTLHGISQTAKPDVDKVQRLFWWTILLISSVFCISLMGISVSYYLEYKAVTSYNRSRNKTLEFPAITICNMNSASRRRTVPYFENTMEELSGFNFVEQATKVLQGDSTGIPEELKSVNWMSYLRNTSQPMEQLIRICEKPKTKLASPDMLTCMSHIIQVHTNYGLCYTFNSRDSIDKYGPVVITEAGFVNGVKFMVDIERDDYYVPPGLGYGVLVLVHDPLVNPSMESGYIVAGPGNEVYITIKKEITKRLGLPYSETECVKPSTDPYYSYARCTNDCYTDLLYKNCNCVPMSEKEDGCTLYDYYTCVLINHMNYQSSMLADCQCVPNCVEVKYDYSVTMTEFPNDNIDFVAKLYNLGNHTMDYYVKNYINFFINYENLEVTTIDEVPAMTIQQLFSDIGGLLGLFLGMSVITLFECFQFIGSLLKHFVRNRCTHKTNK